MTQAWRARHEVISYRTLEGIELAELALTGDAEAAQKAKMEALQAMKIQSIEALAKRK